MCVIVVKPKGIELPFKKDLKNCFHNNDDGAGFMFTDGGKVIIRKGLMTFKRFWKVFRSYNLHAEDTIVFHFRLSTSAKATENFTHPFPLTSDYERMRRTVNAARVGIVHNGVIGNIKTADDISDTMRFIDLVMAPFRSTPNLLMHSAFIQAKIYELGKGKWCLLDNKGTIVILPLDKKGWIEHKGCWYSNNSYERLTFDHCYSWSSERFYYDQYRFGWSSYKNQEKVYSIFDECACGGSLDPIDNDAYLCIKCGKWYERNTRGELICIEDIGQIQSSEHEGGVLL